MGKVEMIKNQSIVYISISLLIYSTIRGIQNAFSNIHANTACAYAMLSLCSQILAEFCWKEGWNL